MRILLLACGLLAALPGVASAQFTIIDVTEEEMVAIKEGEKVSHEAQRAIDVLEMDRVNESGHRKFRVSQARIGYEKLVNARKNPGYAREPERSETLQQFTNLELSDTEYGKLLDLLAEFEVQEWIHRLGGSATTVAFDRDGIVPALQAAAGEWLRKSAEIKSRREENIAALLGSARYELWQQYLKNRKRWFSAVMLDSEDHREVSILEHEIQKILADAHQPLTMPQVMPLVKVLMEGVQRERLRSGRRENEDRSAESLASFNYQVSERLKENQKSILDAVAPHLNDLQLAALMAGFDPKGK